ncbi:transposase [Fulvivirgaceae bacterium BMA10]|uniref:Transposase n=1 Tax=Splendidivirga corallicola TaxID=3051826 RepID=A0ABT8KWJ7_9BACT|nr:transposase [Fulvivirgaceae bacterium BMA10]
MGYAYRIDNPEGIYFVTFTVVEWIDVFTRPCYSEIIIESLKYCQRRKGLIIYAYCIMSNHVHLIVSSDLNNDLSRIIGDFKKFTSNKIIKSIEMGPESRRNWMLWIFQQAGLRDKNNKRHKFWKNGNHPEELFTGKFLKQKLSYIHNNPVAAQIVENPEDYVWSSAKSYAGKKGLIDIEFLY